MCTILVLHRVRPEAPLVIAANRDEFYARPATPPRLLKSDALRIVGGCDVESGGTWMGLNDAGVLVALTNQRTYGGADRSLSSRGPLVVEALNARSATEVTRYLAALDVRRYNPFNLVYGDGEAAFAAYARRESRDVRIEPVPTGVHVLPNDELDSPWFAKVAWLTEGAGTLAPSTWDELPDRLSELLAGHRRPDLEEIEEPPTGSPFDKAMIRELGAVCIHTPVYGTRSASIAAVEPGRVVRYAYADGPPCRTPFIDYTQLLSS